ncbi:MAPEG family protein [Marinobacter fonticola]|uniref:MAPEG family protein n=1 Tax=Marinobacter fonticola TaxID=2603215 RepID=UPI0011E757C7|nr:MAPEG family protein [Marinobacter fonticola]
MIIPVTAVFAAITAMLMLFLAWRVTTFRRKYKTALGDGGQQDFQVAIRAHGNLVEYAPIALILMAIGELNGVAAVYIYGVGMLFIIGRLLHAWGFIQSRGGYALSRMIGVLFTWLAILIMALLMLINVARVSL